MEGLGATTFPQPCSGPANFAKTTSTVNKFSGVRPIQEVSLNLAVFLFGKGREKLFGKNRGLYLYDEQGTLVRQ